MYIFGLSIFQFFVIITHASFRSTGIDPIFLFSDILSDLRIRILYQVIHQKGNIIGISIYSHIIV